MAMLRRSCAAAAGVGRAHKLDLRGIFPPITTPFNKDESLAFDKLKDNLAKLERFPFKGYVVQGSNGEFPLLTREERIAMVRCVRQQLPKNRLIIAGSSCESTLHTIDLTQAMAEAGADAVMVVNPSYFKSSMTFESLVAYYELVSNESPVPVILYNMPANTGIDLNHALLTRLSKHPNIIGVKDSGGDIAKLARVVTDTCESDFQVMAGSVGFLLPSMLVGCVGGIVGMANILGGEVCEMHALAEEGRYHDALSLHRRLIAPNSLVTRELGVPAMKAAMDSVGLYGGPCRRPLLALSEEQMNKVLEAFQHAGYPLSGQLKK